MKTGAMVKIIHHSYQVFLLMLVSGVTDINQNNDSLLACYGAISLLQVVLGRRSENPKKVSANTPLMCWCVKYTSCV